MKTSDASRNLDDDWIAAVDTMRAGASLSTVITMNYVLASVCIFRAFDEHRTDQQSQFIGCDADGGEVMKHQRQILIDQGPQNVIDSSYP